MTITILVVLIVLGLMSIALFYLLKKEVDNINEMCKVYFLLKTQKYTDNINRENKEIDVVKEKIEVEKKDNENNDSTIVYVEKKANYQIDDLLKMMKTIDSKFIVDDKMTISNFIETYVTDNRDSIRRFFDLKKMKEYIDEIGIYNIIVGSDEEKEDIKKQLVLIDEDIFNEYYSGKTEFDIEDFNNYLEYEIGKCDPTIYVYVGNKEDNYDEINNRIKTVYDKNIYKGIKIVYLNKLYDYSL